tara:strand:- start:749 stop:943 length:195 start_codon:yes stop_codon:yes gene_type:complete
MLKVIQSVIFLILFPVVNAFPHFQGCKSYQKHHGIYETMVQCNTGVTIAIIMGLGWVIIQIVKK